jgi:hypothetical protein
MNVGRPRADDVGVWRVPAAAVCGAPTQLHSCATYSSSFTRIYDRQVRRRVSVLVCTRVDDDDDDPLQRMGNGRRKNSSLTKATSSRDGGVPNHRPVTPGGAKEE